MITILTRLGHSRDNYLRLLEELKTVPDVHFVAVLNNGQEPVDGVECVTYEGEYHGGNTLTFGYKSVKTPWLFVLDSDEWYTPLQLRTMMEILPKLHADVQAVAVMRRNFEPFFETSWYAWPDWQIRFYRCTPELCWRGAPHETCNVTNIQRFTGTSFAVLHDHFDLSVRKFMEPYFAKPREE